VTAPCSVNLTGCGPTRKHNEKYGSREKVLKIDEIRTAARFNTEELRIGAKAYAKELNETPWPEGHGFFQAPRLRRITPLRSGHHSSPGLKAWGFLEVL